MSRSAIILAERAMLLPGIKPETKAELQREIARMEEADRLRTGNAVDLAAFKRRSAEAFESDMKPVTEAIVTALKEGDIQALKGLRSLLPFLLHEVNQDPALADLLALQLGAAVLAGLNTPPEAQQ